MPTLKEKLYQLEREHEMINGIVAPRMQNMLSTVKQLSELLLKGEDLSADTKKKIVQLINELSVEMLELMKSNFSLS